MATVFFHIGAPKTATSTLQHALANNYHRLLKGGVLYPRDIRHGNAHHPLVCDLLEKHRGQTLPDIWYGDIPRQRSWELLQSEINRHEHEIHSVIISSELLFGQVHNLDSILGEVSAKLNGHDIRVIVYLRRQDQLYSSFYNQDVKGIRHWGESAYQFYQTHQIFELGYYTILNMWSDALGRDRVLIRPFEAVQWPEFDVVKDFCSLLGDICLPGAEIQNDDSLGMVQLYVKRCLNKIGFKKSINDEVLRILYTICPEEPAKDCLYIHKNLYKKYREEWLVDNRCISEVYLSNRDLFKCPIPNADQVKMYEIDRFVLALFVANMFKVFAQGRYRKHRQLFSKATLLVLAEQNLWNALDAESRSTMLEWATKLER